MNSEQLKALHKGLSDLERVLRNGVPEVVILRGIGVAKGNVADNTERDKRYLIYIAGLGNGARLHVDSLGLREQFDDAAHLLLAIHKPVARNHKACMNLDVFIVNFQLLALAKQTGNGRAIPELVRIVWCHQSLCHNIRRDNKVHC